MQRKRNMQERWIRGVALAAMVMAPGLALAAGGAPSLASEELGGTRLTLIPQIPFQSAVLRVAGPDGYALTESFEESGAISVDLVAGAEKKRRFLDESSGEARVVERGDTLVDGRYRYELVLKSGSGDRQTTGGDFFVEGGIAIPRSSVQWEQALPRQEPAAAPSAELSPSRDGGVAPTMVVDNFVFIVDTANDQHTFLELQTDTPVGAPLIDWQLANLAGDLRLERVFPSHLEVMALTDSGFVGIGTTAPQNSLHVRDSNGFQVRLSDNASSLVLENFANHFQVYSPSAGTFPLSIRGDAPTGSLVMSSSGAVGLGTFSPSTRLHVIGDGATSGNFEQGTLIVERTDGVTANIRFRATGGAFGQSYLFQNNPANGLFSIRDETGAASVLSIFPNGANATMILRNGRWGLQVTNPQHPIHTNVNNARLNSVGQWVDGSSRVHKKEIEDLSLEEAIAALAGLRPVKWASIYEEQGRRQVGFIAEEVPELVAQPGMDALSALELVGVLTRVVQQQQTELTELRELVARMAAGDAGSD
jgi:hypothetical protein